MGLVDSSAAARSQRRILNAGGQIRVAFDRLDAGCTFDDLIELTETSAAYLLAMVEIPEAFHMRLAGTVAAAALMVVESDREHVRQPPAPPAPGEPDPSKAYCPGCGVEIPPAASASYDCGVEILDE